MDKTETSDKKLISASGLAQGNVRFVRGKDLETVGVCAAGEYIGTVEEKTKYGLRRNLQIRASNGDLIIVNQGGNLLYRLNQAIEKGLVPGAYMEVVFRGKSAMTKGDFAGTIVPSFEINFEETDEAA